MIDHPGMIVSLEFHQKTILMNYIISSSDKVDFTIVIGFYTTCIRDTVNVLKYRTFLFLFSDKMLVFRTGIHQILNRIANREDPDQTAS